MPKLTGAKRYAQAVFEIALEREALDVWQADLKRIAAAVKEPEVAALLDNVKVPLHEKIRFAAERLKKANPGVNPLALNLLFLLIAKGRLNILDRIVTEYQRLVNQHRGVEEAEVAAAIPLEEKDKEGIQEQLASITGKKILLEAKVNPAIMGGLVIRIGDKLIDGSTRNKLLALKKELTAGMVG